MAGPLFDGIASADEDEPGAAGEIVRVALPVPADPLADSLYDYRVPPVLRGRAIPGCRVLVPFAGRPLTGVVVAAGASPTRGDRTLSAITEVVDDEPSLSRELIDVLAKEAERVLCPLGIALAAALPAGSTPKPVRRVELTARGRSARAAGVARGRAAEILAALAAEALTPAALARRFPRSEDTLAALRHDGLVVVRTQLRGPSAKRIRIRLARVADGLDVEAVCREALARAPRQAALLRQIAEAKEVPTAALGATAKGASAALRALTGRGFVRTHEQEVARNVFGGPPPPDTPVELTVDQTNALAPILETIREHRAQRFLLHGVTGSGKTEVYLRAITQALEQGRRALVLVPEITLTHQIVARLRGRFGDRLAVLHSGLNAGERLEQWERLRSGEVPIAVGARSALFAPFDDLGVIVIDEEHDPAYKNEEGFRYHARSLAAERARAAGCPVVLGSATPALETRVAAERGEIRRLVLARRIGGRPLPAVELVNLAEERARGRGASSAGGKKSPLTKPLRTALRSTLDEGGQVILFLNRRGFSTQILCFECGNAERCEHCDVALVYHSGEHRLRCHYCDFTRAPADDCRSCGAPGAALLGLGTQRLEEEVRAEFSDARIARLDRDTASRKGTTEAVLRGLRDRQIDILIGTQIVAKGHDFPGVRLVGVIAADVGLHLPDFRAAERCFQLLTQVAGRAGRDRAPGRVIVQTFAPDHYALAPVVSHDYERFFADEVRGRRALGYPPFGHLALALVSAEDELDAQRAGEELASAARESGTGREEALEIYGPIPAPLARLRGRYRMHVLARSAHAEPVRRAAIALSQAALRSPRGVQVSVDANPTSML